MLKKERKIPLEIMFTSNFMVKNHGELILARNAPICNVRIDEYGFSVALAEIKSIFHL